MADELPHGVHNGLSFASYGYYFISGSAEEKLATYKVVHLICSLSTVLILTLLYLRIKDKVDYRLFMVGAVKIYLVIFYSFIQAPYQYLYLSLVMISVPMLFVIWQKEQLKLAS